MVFDPNEVSEKHEAAKEKNKKRLEQEKIKRDKTKITEKDAKRLKENEERKRKKKVAKKLEEMRSIKKDISETAKDKINRLQEKLGLKGYNVCSARLETSHWNSKLYDPKSTFLNVGQSRVFEGGSQGGLLGENKCVGGLDFSASIDVAPSHFKDFSC